MRDNGFSHYLETSAKSGQNVNNLFETITKHLYITHEANLDKFVSGSYLDITFPYNRPSFLLQRDEDDASEAGTSFVSLN